MKTIAVVATAAMVLAGCQDGKPVSVALPAAPPSEAQKCIEGKIASLTEARDLLAAGEPWKAHLRVNFCAGLLDDAEYRAVAHATETATRKKDLGDATLPAARRLLALDQLTKLDPDFAAAQAPLKARLEAIEAEAAQKLKAADAARRRNQGVSLGMTPDDVRASSWGAPRKINRTINQYGTREQWVYDGGYLYFRNGVLESISN